MSTSYSQHEAAARQLLRVASANHPWDLSSADLDATRGLDTTEAKLLAANVHLQLQLIEESARSIADEKRAVAEELRNEADGRKDERDEARKKLYEIRALALRELDFDDEAAASDPTSELVLEIARRWHGMQAGIERLRAELDKVSGGWEARVESRQKLTQERDQARAELDRLRASNYADEQLRFDAYAELLNVLDEGWHPPVGTGTFRGVRAAIVKALDLRAQYKTERDEARVERDRLRARLDQHLADENSAQAANDRLRNELTRERAIYADSPDDRLYHAADHTWWRRADDGRLVRADTPAIRLVSEPDAE